MMLPSIAQHARQHGIIPLKKYGQNFIFDQSLCDKIVKANGLKTGSLVLEIGPGTAGLTRAILARTPKLLTVIELDPRCLPLLQDIQALHPNLSIVQGNALEFDLSCLGGGNVEIIANLPYQLGTELLITWLKNSHLINSMTLMLQKEVVDRMRAAPGTKIYGRLSVICQLVCQVTKCFDVKPEAFYPAPKVHSSVVKLLPRAAALAPKLLRQVELITKFAFGERRKMIKSSLKKLTPLLGELLDTLQINATFRAENLRPADYLALAALMIKTAGVECEA